MEDLVGAIADQVQAGYVKHIGLSMVDADKVGGKGMRNFVFTDGIMSLA